MVRKLHGVYVFAVVIGFVGIFFSFCFSVIFFLLFESCCTLTICFLVNWQVTIRSGSKGWRLYEVNAEVRACIIWLQSQCTMVVIVFFLFFLYFFFVFFLCFFCIHIYYAYFILLFLLFLLLLLFIALISSVIWTGGRSHLLLGPPTWAAVFCCQDISLRAEILCGYETDEVQRWN